MDDLSLALHLADVADEISMRRFHQPDLVVSTKDDGTTVTDADTAVEEAVRAVLAEHRPHDAVLGEELGGAREPGGRRWILDPVDGTTAFSEGREVWGFLAALDVDGAVRVGVVSAPALGRRYWASVGGGTWGGPIGAQPTQMRVSETDDLLGARVALSLPAAVLAPRLGPGLLPLTTPLRPVAGEPALAVTTARADLGFKSAGGPWDLAPYVVIVEEAGGRYSDASGGRSLDVQAAVVSNGMLHDQVLEALQAGPDEGDGV